MNTESYACFGKPNDYRNNFIGSLVPLSPRIWEPTDIEVPENLKFIKAKTAFVPIAEFIMGSPDEAAPFELLMAKVYKISKLNMRLYQFPHVIICWMTVIQLFRMKWLL
jgi:hypothetical protein